MSAGAGAGLAAVFNAPLAGLIFVLEEVRRDFQPIVFGSAFLAAAIADIMARIGSGQFPVFAVPSYPVLPLIALPVFSLLGIAAALTGGAVGLIGWFSPLMIGSGHTLAESALKGELLLSVIPLFFLLRFLLTATCYSTGAPGGIFAPLLVLRALIGLGVGQIAHNLAPEIVPIPAVFAVVGMAAYFTAIVRALLTGIILIVEMTGNYSQMLPLLVSCFCAHAVVELLKDLPIYEALLECDLRRGSDKTLLKQPVVVDFMIQPDAPFVGL